MLKISFAKTGLFAASVILGLSTISPVLADQPISQQQQPLFQLNANVTDHVRMSRSELPQDQAQTAPIAARAPQAAPQISLAPPNRGIPAPLAARVAQSDAPDQGWMKEYNVDWSTWMSELADRWYYVLHGAEQIVNMEFVTQRPAQIQFTCWRNGQISDVILKQSSGNPVYDKMQVLALMQVMPLKAFPSGTKRNSVTLVQGWESHIKAPGENGYVPGSFGKGYPAEKVREWVSAR